MAPNRPIDQPVAKGAGDERNRNEVEEIRQHGKGHRRNEADHPTGNRGEERIPKERLNGLRPQGEPPKETDDGDEDEEEAISQETDCRAEQQRNHRHADQLKTAHVASKMNDRVKIVMLPPTLSRWQGLASIVAKNEFMTTPQKQPEWVSITSPRATAPFPPPGPLAIPRAPQSVPRRLDAQFHLHGFQENQRLPFLTSSPTATSTSNTRPGIARAGCRPLAPHRRCAGAGDRPCEASTRDRPAPHAAGRRRPPRRAEPPPVHLKVETPMLSRRRGDGKRLFPNLHAQAISLGFDADRDGRRAGLEVKFAADRCHHVPNPKPSVACHGACRSPAGITAARPARPRRCRILADCSRYQGQGRRLHHVWLPTAERLLDEVCRRVPILETGMRQDRAQERDVRDDVTQDDVVAQRPPHLPDGVRPILAQHDELGNHGVVMERHLVAARHAGVDPHPGPTGSTATSTLPMAGRTGWPDPRRRCGIRWRGPAGAAPPGGRAAARRPPRGAAASPGRPRSPSR